MQSEELEQATLQQTHKLFLDFLLTVPVLCSLNVEAQNDFLDRCELKSFKAGQLIIKQGDPPAHFFVILSGHGTAYQVLSGDEVGYQSETPSLQTSATRLRSLGRGGD